MALKDITLGQYFPGSTVIHKLDPRTKLLFVVLYIVALFTAKGLLAYGLLLAVLACAIAVSKVHLKTICLLYTSPSPRDGATSRMPSSA